MHLPSGGRALLATTPLHLRVWATSAPGSWHSYFTSSSANTRARASTGSLSTAGAQGALPPAPVAQLEAVCASPCSQLQLWWPEGVEEAPSRFAWLVGGVVYHGDLDWEAAEAAAEAAEGVAAAAAGGEVLAGVASLPLEAAGVADGGLRLVWRCVFSRINGSSVSCWESLDSHRTCLTGQACACRAMGAKHHGVYLHGGFQLLPVPPIAAAAADVPTGGGQWRASSTA